MRSSLTTGLAFMPEQHKIGQAIVKHVHESDDLSTKEQAQHPTGGTECLWDADTVDILHRCNLADVTKQK